MLYLGILHLVNVSALVVVLLYLLSTSLVTKFKDCESFQLECVDKPGSIIYDWKSLDQYAILISLLIVVFIGSISSFFNHRQCQLIAILLHSSYIIQIITIELSDSSSPNYRITDKLREGPPTNPSVDRLILYTHESGANSALKLILLFLIIVELLILLFNFILSRYRPIFEFKLQLEGKSSSTSSSH